MEMKLIKTLNNLKKTEQGTRFFNNGNFLIFSKIKRIFAKGIPQKYLNVTNPLN
jgi:hypothetical protein